MLCLLFSTIFVKYIDCVNYKIYNFEEVRNVQQNIPPRWSIENSIYEAYTINNLKTSKTHWHSHFLFNLVTEGEGLQEINGHTIPFEKGSVIILSPMDFHRNIIEKENNVSVNAVKFSDKIFYDSLTKICSFDNFPVISNLSDDDFKKSSILFSLLLDEQKKKSLLGSEKFAQSLIEQLVILALRATDKIYKDKEISLLHNALIYIHYNFKCDITVGNVASHVGYSPNYFSAQFKKETGIEFRHYLLNLRLDFAMNLLRFSKLSVTEVCFESGFNTLSHFSHAFKKKFGESPEKIKENYR